MSSGDIICPTCGQYHCVCGLILQNLANNTFSELGKEHAKTLAEPLGEFIGAEIAKLQHRIAMLESQLAAANEMPTVPYDVLDDMLELVMLLGRLSIVQSLPPGTNVKLENVYTTIKAMPPHECRIQEAQK